MARFNKGGPPKINRGGPKKFKPKRASYGGTGSTWSKEWKVLSGKILVRDNFTCKTCNRHVTKLLSHERLEVDHIIRVSKGGTDSPSNLITRCSTCHAKRPKHGLTKKANLKRKKNSKYKAPKVYNR